MDAYERFVLRRYAANMLRPRSRNERPSYAAVRWVEEQAGVLGISRPPDFGLEERFDETEPVDTETRRALVPLLAELQRPAAEPAPSPLQRRIDWLAEILKLERQDVQILGAIIRIIVSKPCASLIEAADQEGSDDTVYMSAVSRILRKPLPAISGRLLRNMPLSLTGILTHHPGFRETATLSATVLRIVRLRRASPESLQRLLLGATTPASLGWTDFDHLEPLRDLAERLIAAALGARTKGVNLLLHGPPGTGKTEFVRTLAERLGAHAVFVGESDDDANEPKRGERIAAFMLARAVAGRGGRRILVVDEADDVFLGVDDGEAEGRRGSKVFMNRLVETTGMPVIWITNAPERLGPAVLRRMDLAIAFPEPGRAIRTRMIQRSLERRRLRLGPGEIARLAALDAPPAVIDRALRLARLVKGKADEAEVAARSITTLLKPRAGLMAAEAPMAFDPALSTADLDLAALAGQVAEARRVSGRLDLSFCLHGPPGTGKSAYARHLAERLDLEVLEKRASDLISPYIGMTERKIADAFREAADKRAMLVLDEADSFLRNRAGARHAWEVSQVNEMLTWMERHPWPFVCTTNLMESLDPATLRRFVFKVRFMAMDTAQAASAFERAFGQTAPPSLGLLDTLTPGDFAVVARKAAVLGVRAPERLLDLLREETDAKPGGGRRAVGFVNPPPGSRPTGLG